MRHIQTMTVKRIDHQGNLIIFSGEDDTYRVKAAVDDADAHALGVGNGSHIKVGDTIQYEDYTSHVRRFGWMVPTPTPEGSHP